MKLIHIVCLFLCFTITSCSNKDTINNKYPILKKVDEKYLDSLINLANARLSLLISSGSSFCIPNRIEGLKTKINTAKGEKESQLLLDSHKTLSSVLKDLDTITSLIPQLNKSTECFAYFIKTKKNPHLNKVELYISRLKDILNCNCIQIKKNKELDEKFILRLKRISKILGRYVDLKTHLFVRDDTIKLKPIIDILRLNGAQKNQIQIHYNKNNKHLSSNGLFFDFEVLDIVNTGQTKDWNKRFRIMSIRQETLYEP